jgi:hypothetical protein
VEPITSTAPSTLSMAANCAEPSVAAISGSRQRVSHTSYVPLPIHRTPREIMRLLKSLLSPVQTRGPLSPATDQERNALTTIYRVGLARIELATSALSERSEWSLSIKSSPILSRFPWCIGVSGRNRETGWDGPGHAGMQLLARIVGLERGSDGSDPAPSKSRRSVDVVLPSWRRDGPVKAGPSPEPAFLLSPGAAAALRCGCLPARMLRLLATQQFDTASPSSLTQRRPCNPRQWRWIRRH